MTTKKNIKNWYNQKHIEKQEKAWRPPQAYPVFLSYFQIIPDKKLLDIGCGTGFLLKEATNKGLKTFGIDISDEAVKIAQNVSHDSIIYVGSGEDLKFDDDFFDYITCIGVLEHFLDIEKGINEIKRVLKKNGKACIVVPNINFIYWKFKKNKGTEQVDINETLLTLEQWKNMFSEAGLNINKVKKDNWFLKQVIYCNPINFRNLLKASLQLLFKFLWLFIPLRYTYQFIFILKK